MYYILIKLIFKAMTLSIKKFCKIFLFFIFLTQSSAFAQEKEIYHKGWIDFNKNGVKDVFEDPTQSIDKRINNLLGQMTVDEKTCQCATLYGFKRILEDELPTPEWKMKYGKMGLQILMNI